MMPRFITEIEIAYDKAFPDSDATRYFFGSEEDRWERKLKEAIKRGTPLSEEEVISLYSSRESFMRMVAYLEWLEGE